LQQAATGIEIDDDEIEDFIEGVTVQRITNINPSDEDVQSIQKEAFEKLESQSIHRVKNAFTVQEVGFGANVRGIFSATATDLMHAFMLGIIKYVMHLAIDRLPPTSKSPIDDLVDDILCPHRSCLKEEFPRTNFTKGFTNLTLLTANEWPGMLLALGLIVSTDAGREVLEMSGKYTENGVGKKAIDKIQKQFEDTTDPGAQKMMDAAAQRHETMHREKAKEEEKEDEPKSKKMNEENEEFEDVLWQCSVSDLLNVMEMMLCYHALYKSEQPILDWSKAKYLDLQNSTRRMMNLIKLQLPRKKAAGWKLQKFHDLLHVADDYFRYGLAQNYNCGPGESGLKVWAKQAGETAQKRGAEAFMSQTGDRTYEKECFETAMEESGFPNYKIPRSPEKIMADQLDDNGPPILKGSSCKIYKGNCLPPKWGGSETRRKGHLSCHPAVLRYFEQNPLSLDPFEEEVRDIASNQTHSVQYWQCYTECDIFLQDVGKRRTLRAHPNYQNTGPYYDFAYVNFEGVVYPGKIVAFVHGSPNDDGVEQYALVHSTIGRTKETRNEDSLLFKHWYLEYEPENIGSEKNPKIYHRSVLHLVPVTSISDAVYAFEERQFFSEGHTEEEETNEATQQDRRMQRKYRHVICVHHMSWWPLYFWNGSSEVEPEEYEYEGE
jgi:hypothetical protein